MSLRFDLASFVRAAFLFVVLVLLATVGRDLGWVRSFLGDVLAVAWVFYVIRTFVKTRASWIAAIAFATGAAVELVQFLLMSMDVQIPNRSLRIVFGATPDWWDILAYAIGAALVLGVDFLTAARGGARQGKP
ncbi:MAG TPA: DUF2809 domain-containing protein [Shinella sp.]|jgi:hypothetical protein|uniref:DUF2809 domain-containing protein n=1 Tax=Shinella sp. TaxID=1870904 RepID=UPI002E149FD3|nr:DUF2809 domain-containing protein [Shinella sp.]